MTDKEILHKAIKKAEENGYNKEQYLNLISLIKEGCVEEKKNTLGEIINPTISLDFDYFEVNVVVPYIIFSHEFAKAFFGEEELGEYNKEDYGPTIINKGWRYHLPIMVLEKNHLKYLEKFL